MAYNIGLNVVEVDGVGAPAIQGAPVSVAGFNIITRRGVANRPTRVTSLKQFLDQFGGFFSGGYGAYMVKGFFDNGGQTAYINRIVSTDATTGATPASKNLKDAKDKDTLQAAAGQRGAADPGGWGNDLYIKIDNSKTPAVRLRETEAASLTGSALTEPVDMSALTKLSVKVDGETAATDIAFLNGDFADPTKAKLAEIRDAINKRTTKLVASVTDDKKIKLTSTGQVASISKVFTRLEVTAANTTLGFTAASQSGKAADLKTTGTTLVVSDEFQPGDAILVSDGATKSITKVLRVTPDTGGIEWVPTIANVNT